MASKKEIEERKTNEQTFSGLFRNGEETPESIIAKVMWGQTTITHNGKQRKLSKEMVAAATALLPYRLPRLNSVDAQVKHVELSHEDWLREIEDAGSEDPKPIT